MAKIITVWGNAGSGKSMFCCNLAKVLTEQKAKALLMNADASTPMLPIWMPDRFLDHSVSIGHLLSGLEMNVALVAEHVTLLKEYPFIGMMGYVAGETIFSYPEWNYEKVRFLIKEAGKLVDYIILDCSSNLLTYFTPAAIESGDVIIRIITPDLRGINYLKSQQALLMDSKFRYGEHMTFAGLARPFHAIEEMEHFIGKFDGLLPYSKELERCGTNGELFQALSYCHKQYRAALELVKERLGLEREEQEAEKEDTEKEEIESLEELEEENLLEQEREQKREQKKAFKKEKKRHVYQFFS